MAETPEFELYKDDGDLLADGGNNEGQIGSSDVPPEEVEPIELKPPTPELRTKTRLGWIYASPQWRHDTRVHRILQAG